MKKITFIGAGSFDFTRELVRDILTYDAFKDAPFLKEKNSEFIELMLPTYLKAIIDEIKCTNLKNGMRRGHLSMMLEAEIHNAENDHMITEDQAEYLRKNYLSFLDNYEP